MKKLFIILAVLLFSSSAFSQLNINLQAGVNFSNLTELTELPEGFPIALTTSPIPGFVIGGNLQIGGSFYFQPGVYWHTLGSELSVSSFSTDNVVINAIQIPAFLGYRIVNTGLFDVRLYAGGSLLFVTKINENEFSFLDQTFSVRKEDFADQVWGVVGGVGLDFTIFTVDLNYEYGLSNLIDTSVMIGLEEIPAQGKNNVIRLVGGLKL